MLQVQAAGVRAENCMADLLQKARIRNASPDFDADNLRIVAQMIDSKRYAKCDKHRILAKCDAAQLLDFVYEVDHVIDVGENIYVGIDLTLDPFSVSSKIRKAMDLRQLRESIGIHDHFVVHMVGDFQCPNPEVVKQSIEDFWQAMAEAINSPASVHCFRFHVS